MSYLSKNSVAFFYCFRQHFFVLIFAERLHVIDGYFITLRYSKLWIYTVSIPMPIWINLMVKSIALHHFAVGTDMALLFFAMEEDPLLLGIVLIIQ